ncbi:MAG: hypothetical protein ACO24J_02435 [Ilumatobacteraceae bacterium]
MKRDNNAKRGSNAKRFVLKGGTIVDSRGARRAAGMLVTALRRSAADA